MIIQKRMEETQFDYKDLKKSVLHMATNWFRQTILILELSNDTQKRKEHTFIKCSGKTAKKVTCLRRLIH